MLLLLSFIDNWCGIRDQNDFGRVSRWVSSWVWTSVQCSSQTNNTNSNYYHYFYYFVFNFSLKFCWDAVAVTTIRWQHFFYQVLGFFFLAFSTVIDDTKMNYGSKTTFIGFDTDKRKLPLSKRFVLYAYDKDTGEIFGRTPSSWGKSSFFFLLKMPFTFFLLDLIHLLVYYLMNKKNLIKKRINRSV